MYTTTTTAGRTGYGNRAYRRRHTLDAPRISGWILIAMSLLAIVFLGLALTRKDGPANSWRAVLALVLTETVADAVKMFLVNMASE